PSSSDAAPGRWRRLPSRSVSSWPASANSEGGILVNIGADPDRSASRSARMAWWPSPRWRRAVVSTWLVFHLAAIIIAPAAVAPSSDLIRWASDWFRPYLGLLYLDHGYHFFAPEPAESTLLAFVAERADGTTVRGRIPDRATRPRLLYHRYFMLTEHMNDAPEEFRDLWHESYAQHIGRQYGATRVTLIQQTHKLPTME